jgi:flagellum-specific peptidoglycan hydrolase FlgJ
LPTQGTQIEELSGDQIPSILRGNRLDRHSAPFALFKQMTTSDFLHRAVAAALAAGHVFPEFAACEAALESGWGESRLAREANNLFGQKSGRFTESLPTLSLPTREFLHGRSVIVPATWPKFYDWIGSFAARMVLLKGESLYAAALASADGQSFVREVSRHWSTDPDRAEKVLEIYSAHQGDLAAQPATFQHNAETQPAPAPASGGGGGNDAAASARAGKEDGK